ncbi:MAG TPA: hypothetical protein VGS79_01870 [Puia sp.]|nr:hypothetical protein [Puia sp.]
MSCPHCRREGAPSPPSDPGAPSVAQTPDHRAPRAPSVAQAPTPGHARPGSVAPPEPPRKRFRSARKTARKTAQKTVRTTARKTARKTGWLLPGILLVLMPKCPVCLAAYIALITGISIPITAATWLRGSLIAICIGVLVWLAVRWSLYLYKRSIG